MAELRLVYFFSTVVACVHRLAWYSANGNADRCIFLRSYVSLCLPRCLCGAGVAMYRSAACLRHGARGTVLGTWLEDLPPFQLPSGDYGDGGDSGDAFHDKTFIEVPKHILRL